MSRPRINKTGKTTSYTWGTITETNVAPGYIPNVKPTYIRFNHNSQYPYACKGGDSGGPVYQNNSAYGLVEGWINNGSTGDCMYTTIDYVENDLGVVILTS